MNITSMRLFNQQLTQSKFSDAARLVEYLCAMQAQEYAMAKWAIGLRIPSLCETDVENAFNSGQILRTHLLRPTWHFVAPADIRWLTQLTAPRVNQASAFMFRQMELTDKIFSKANNVFGKALAGNKHLTRAVLKDELVKSKISTTGFRMAYLLLRAELDGVITSGPREGNQFTYALLEERVPKAKPLTREEALAELVKRYFISRGPATIQDFVTWSRLTVKDATAGLAMTRSGFISEKVDGKEYFFTSSSRKATATRSFYMPDYDEYGMSYKDRSAIFDKAKWSAHISRGNPVFNRMIIVDGTIAGTWNRTVSRNKVTVNSSLFSKLPAEKKKILKKEEEMYRSFLGVTAE